MAQVNFDDIDFNNMSGGANNNSVGFFSLKNDGDEAIVRIMHDNTASFDILTEHSIQVDGKFRSVNCIRNATDSLDKCPLCSNGNQVQRRIYIHMIRYNRNDDGTITPVPVVWARSLNYAKTIKSYIDNYGPMSDVLCKIIRHGAPRDMKTTYEIVPNLNKNVYRDDLYPKVSAFFEDYHACGTAVMDKSYDELVTFVNTGKFPEKVRNNNMSQAADIQPYITASNPNSTGNGYVIPPSSYSNQPTPPVYTPVRDAMVTPQYNGDQNAQISTADYPRYDNYSETVTTPVMRPNPQINNNPSYGNPAPVQQPKRYY